MAHRWLIMKAVRTIYETLGGRAAIDSPRARTIRVSDNGRGETPWLFEVWTRGGTVEVTGQCKTFSSAKAAGVRAARKLIRDAGGVPE